MVRSTSLRPRLLLGSAVVALAAACSHGNSTQPTVAASSTPSPSATGSAAPAMPCTVPNGVAFEPDGATTAGLRGVQVVHFEDVSGNLCPPTGSPGTTPAQPAQVTFSSSVGAIGFSTDFTDAVALLADPSGSGAYDQAQDVFGALSSQLVPSGSAYQLAAMPSPTPSPAAVLVPNGTSIALTGGTGNSGIALVTGPAAGGLVALTSLANPPPIYGNSVPFGGSGYAIQPTVQTGFSTVRVGPFLTTTSGTTTTSVATALVRGAGDLVSFSVTGVSTGLQFNAVAENASLGSGVQLTGSGAVAFAPSGSTGIALVGRAGSSQNTLTLINGLPNKINLVSQVATPGTVINSIAIDSSATIGYVATDAGIYVVSGVNGTALTGVAPFAPNPAAPSANALPYVDCNGASVLMTNVQSVAISTFSTAATATTPVSYLVALGRSATTTCASGFNDAVVAVPIVPSSGLQPTPSPSATATAASTASPVPTSFTQNNVMAPPANADLLTVR